MADVVQHGSLGARTTRIAPYVLSGMLLSGCFIGGSSSPDRSELLKDPAAKVRMAGSDELGHFSREREFTIEGQMEAFDAYVFGIAASEQEVISFYDQQLRALGWTRDDLAVFPGSTDLKARGWCKPRMAYRLAIVDQARAFPSSFYRGKTYVTVYDAGLHGRPPEAKCGGR